MDALIGAIRARREEALKDASPEEWAQYSGRPSTLPWYWHPDYQNDEPIDEYDDYED